MSFKVSVVIPTYNRSKLVCEAIESVLAQTYKADEIIVVDDGSTDNTKDVISELYGDVIVIRQKNMGVSSARNNGVYASSNNLVAFLDSDDTWHKDKLKHQLKLHKECKASFTDEVWIKDNNKINIPKKFDKTNGLYEKSLNYCLIAPSSVIIEKTLFLRLGEFDESLKVCEDYDLWLRVFKESKFCFCNEKLLNKRSISSDQLSFNNDNLDKYHIQSLEKLYDRYGDVDFLETLKTKYTNQIKKATKHNNMEEAFHFEQKLKEL